MAFRSKITAADEAKMRKMMIEGVSYRDISKKIGCGYGAVSKRGTNWQVSKNIRQHVHSEAVKDGFTAAYGNRAPYPRRDVAPESAGIEPAKPKVKREKVKVKPAPGVTETPKAAPPPEPAPNGVEPATITFEQGMKTLAERKAFRINTKIDADKNALAYTRYSQSPSGSEMLCEAWAYEPEEKGEPRWPTKG